MSRVRKDTKGRALRRGECYLRAKNLYAFYYMDSFGKRRCLYAKDLMELRDKEKEMQRNMLDKLDVYLLQKADINYVFDRYIDLKKSSLKQSTLANYLYTYQKYVRDGFGKRKLDTVRYSDVVLFYKDMLDKGYSLSTVDNVHTLLHPTFKMAVRDNVLRNNPADGAVAEIKRSSDAPKGIREALTYEQEKAFLDYIRTNPNEKRWVPIMTVMFGTGCRIGELIGLRWDDVDLEERVISINHNVTYGPKSKDSYRCSFEVTTPKTQAGVRTIPMLDKVHEAFLMEKEMQETRGFESCLELDGLSNFIFLNRNGTLHKSSSIDKVIKRIVSDYNEKEIISSRREKREPIILPSFSCHVARHTFCSRLCENETNIKVIQEIMGHKSIETTLGIYAHVSESKKKEAFKELNNRNVL